MAKAFDIIKHTILEKLKKYGVRQAAQNLLNPVQTVRINGKYNYELMVNIGVPQGTILVPIPLRLHMF